MIQLQVIAPVLLPALFILCRAERFFLPVTDNSYAIRGDAIRDKSSLKRFGAILPKCRSREHTTRRRRTWSAFVAAMMVLDGGINSPLPLECQVRLKMVTMEMATVA
jgi:hypothetical protein